MSRHLFVTKTAVRQAINLKLVPDNYGKAETKVAEMAAKSAPFTHGRVNRRFGDIGLLLVDNTVERVITLKGSRGKASKSCSTCHGAGKIPVEKVEHDDPEFIRCPDCKT